MNTIPSSQIRQLLLLLLLAGLFGLLAWNLRGFVSALLGAYTLYVILRPASIYLTTRWRFPGALADALLMLASLAVIVLPVTWLIGQLGVHVASALDRYPEILRAAEQIGRDLESAYGLTLITEENIARLTQLGLREGQRLVSATLDGLVTVLVAYLVLWFLLRGGEALESRFYDWLPLKPTNKVYVRRQLTDLVFANAVGIPFMGLVQGLAGLVAYWAFGIHDLWLWFGITFLSGMLPVIGTMLAYIPLTLILLGSGRPVEAMIMLLYGFFVIGSVDNFARMWLLKKIGHTHPLITFFGVLAGLKLFGFIGFIFGPIMISLGLLLVRIYEKEYA